MTDTNTTRESATSGRSRVAEAFLDARQYTAPQTVSACEGWTAHEVTAHLAPAAAEITRHLEPYLAGEPVPPTRSFEEREPPTGPSTTPRASAPKPKNRPCAESSTRSSPANPTPSSPGPGDRWQ